MKTDKGIRKIMQKAENEFLTYGFETKLMNQIFREVEKNKSRAERWEIILVSAISVLMIIVVFVVLKAYLNMQFDSENILKIFSFETYRPFFFFIYIALLVLLLLFADTFFRRLKQKVKG